MESFAYTCKYDGERAVMYYTGGPIYYHVGGDRNWRNNNPGNCKVGNTSKKFNQIGEDGEFAIFPSYSQGYNCMEYVVFSTYGDKTIEKMMYKYAPPEENDTEGYIKMIVNATGLGRDTVLNTLNSTNRKKLLEVMIRKEGTKKGRVVHTNILPE